MKLLIEIPERIYDTIQADEMISREQLAVLQMHILEGTPLDEVLNEIKAEIEKLDGAYVACDDDKCYMITDKELAERFKRTVRE